MTLQLREFVLDGACPEPGTGTGAPWQDIAEALRPRFGVTAGRAAAIQRVWLDTFDRRLRRAGLTLEYVSLGRISELALAAADGPRLIATVPRLTWPRPADQVPHGPLRDRLAPVAGIRALLPILASTGTRRDLRVLDSETKTVARLTIDQAVAGGGGAAALPPRLTVTAVRGYDAQADRIARLMAAVPGVAPASDSFLDSALAAAGRIADGYTGKLEIKLAPAMPAAPAVAAILLRLLDMAEANLDGVVRDIDTEFLHDLRIAVRRSRAALKLTGDALPDGMAARFAAEFRWLGQLTTPMRDLDVHLLGFERAAAGLVTAAPQDLQPLHASLIRYRAAERRRLTRALRSARFRSLASDWRSGLVAVRTASDSAMRGWSATARQPIASLAAARIGRAHRKLVRSGSAVTAASPEHELHTVRKRGKELRYLLEFFATLHEPVTHRKAVSQLKQLQDCLGDIQDGHVQRETIRSLATRMVAEGGAPAATLLAMGELAAQLDAGASAARQDFARRFAQFTSGRNSRRIALLTGAAV